MSILLIRMQISRPHFCDSKVAVAKHETQNDQLWGNTGPYTLLFFLFKPIWGHQTHCNSTHQPSVHLCSCDAQYPQGSPLSFSFSLLSLTSTYADTHLNVAAGQSPPAVVFLFVFHYTGWEQLITAAVWDNSQKAGFPCLNKCTKTTANKCSR